MPDVTTSANVDTLLQAADFSTFRTSLGLTALATTTPGTGVATALAVNVGTDGAFVVRGGNAGTPSTIVLTNATGTAAGLTAGTASAVAVGGITGLGANVGTFLATPSSANLLATVTGETGTGALVFGSSPTIDAPTLTGTTTAATVNATNANVTNFLPVSNDGAAIGASGTAFSDLFLASGAVINFNAGNYTLTHSAGVLTANLDLRVTTPGTNSASVATLAGAQSLSNKDILYTVEPGADDTSYGEKLAGILAGDTIGQWDLVYLDSTSGRWELADSDAVATGGGVLLGLAVTSGTDGNALTVLLRGIVRNDGWTWASAGLKLYSSGTPGALTATQPSGTDDVIRPIADTLSDDCILFAPGQFWQTHV